MGLEGTTTTEPTTTAPVVATTTDPKEPVSTDPTTTTNTTPPVEEDLGWTDKQKAYVKGLRDENAKYRTRSKEQGSQVDALTGRLDKFETGLKTLFGEEDDKLTPEERIEALQGKNEQLAIQSALQEAAFEYGIGKESFDYFQFLVTKKLNELEEGEELADADLDAIAAQAKAKVPANTSVGDGGGGPPPTTGDGALTLNEFKVMGIGERSLLYQKDKNLYDSMVKQEKAAQT